MFRKSSKHRDLSTAQNSIGPNLGFLSREAYNAIRTNLTLTMHHKDQGGRVVGITSPSPRDGKSYSSVNLAYALAKDGNRVLLINGDLRLPSLERYLNLPCKKGLSNYLCGDMDPEEGLPVVEHVLDVDLSVLAAGDIPPNPSELLGSSEMEELLKDVRQTYDFILIDLPPISSVIDAIAVSPYMDGIILVVRQGHTHKRAIRETMSNLNLSGTRLLGFIVNDYAPSAAHKYQYNHTYYS